jgi:hypothetical protein
MYQIIPNKLIQIFDKEIFKKKKIRFKIFILQNLYYFFDFLILTYYGTQYD